MSVELGNDSHRSGVYGGEACDLTASVRLTDQQVYRAELPSVACSLLTFVTNEREKHSMTDMTNTPKFITCVRLPWLDLTACINIGLRRSLFAGFALFMA